MRVDRVTANVRYSKQMPDGAFKTVELGCESSLTDGDEDWREVQTNLYRQLGEQMRYVFSGNGSGKVAQEPPMPETLHPNVNTGVRNTRPNTSGSTKKGRSGTPIKHLMGNGLGRNSQREPESCRWPGIPMAATQTYSFRSTKHDNHL